MVRSMRMRLAGHVARIEKKSAYSLLVGMRERKRPIGMQRRRQVDNIEMDFTEIGWAGMVRIDLAHDRDKCTARVNTAMNPQVP
jgi:hypothetical protein